MSATAAQAPVPNPAPGGWDLKAAFERAAATYDEQAGGLTRVISRHLLAISDPPLSRAAVVLDNATGPGITCTEILRELPESRWPREIHATDLSPAMIAQVEKRGHAQIEAQVMDAQELKFPDGKFSHIYMCFVIFAVPDPVKAARELYRTLQPGGVAYVTTWIALGWQPPVERAMRRVRPDCPPFKSPIPEEWKTAEKLGKTLVEAGFEKGKVEVQAFEAKSTLEIWDGCLDFVRSGFMDMAIGAWSEDEKTQFYQAAEDEFTKAKKAGTTPDFPAWVGVARK